METYDICCEVQHGRKKKRNFKGVVSGIIIGATIVSTLATTTIPAFAASTPASYHNEITSIIEMYGVNYETALQSVMDSIGKINTLKKNGVVSIEMLEQLSTQLFDLEGSIDKNNWAQVVSVSKALDLAESAVNDVDNGEMILNTVAFIRTDLGITETVEVAKATQAKEKGYELKSFRDVKPNHWAYKDIMRSVELGLVQGTESPDKNGVGAFNPDGMMTVAQFITVVVRAVEPGQEFDNGDSTLWYAGTWDEAVNLGILYKNDFGGLYGAKASKAITREEMAYVITNALNYMGDKPDQIVDVSRIPDLGKVSAAYRNEVLNVYSLGIICGVDNTGTFSPGGVLTRAQASAVMNRLLDKDSRKKVEFGEVPSAVSQTVAGVQTWVEGQSHSKPKAGDIVIKSDGTKVTLKETKIGNITVLGVGQGVDIYTGWGNLKVGYHATDEMQFNRSDWSLVCKSSANGEVHTEYEWGAIQGLYTRPDRDGKYNGEVANTFYKWDAEMQWWSACYGDIKN